MGKITNDCLIGDNLRHKMFDGITKVANCVGATLGARGRLVAIEQNNGSPVLTKDGVTAAKAIGKLKDPYENMGANLLIEVASKSNKDCGDGTTTSTVLAYALVKEGLKAVDKGSSATSVKHGIDKAINYAIDELKKLSVDVSDENDLKHIACVSANNDESIGDLITEAIEKVGANGVITVKESSTMQSSIDYVEGMQFDKGYISPYFVTNPTRMECVFKNPYILVTDKSISSINEIANILNQVAQTGRPILFICDDMSGDALINVINNNLRGALKSCVVKSPFFGENKKAFLEDLCVLTNATFIDSSLGAKLNEITLDKLGSCASIEVTKDKTVIVDGSGSEENIKSRIESLEEAIKRSDDEYAIEKMKERLAKLSGGVAVVNIGASTETEMTEKKHRVEDTLSATRSAIEEGVVCGGGVTLVTIAEKIKSKIDELEDSDEKIGFNIVVKALEEPMRKMAENAGLDGSVLVNDVKKDKSGKMGYNLATNTWENLFDNGIIDPTKVTRSALVNSSSIASLILMCDCGIISEEEKDNAIMIGTPSMPM